MSRILVSLCIALALASTSYGDLIGNWENYSMDGWTVRSGNTASSTLSGDYGGVFIGNTLDSGCVTVIPTTLSGGVRCIQFATNATQRAWFTAGTAKLTVDGSVFADDPTYDTDWAMTGNIAPCKLFIGSAMNSMQYITPVGGEWLWNPSNGNMSKKLTFNIPIQTGTITWVTVYLGGQAYSNSGVTSYGALHFDNVVLTPEPATMGLLGLGALALIRRKK